jgi:flagellum-specific peptidoglycan hydrolase FlgJ
MTDYNDLSVKGIVESAKAVYGDTPMAKLAATQAILESGLYNGKPSNLAKKANNLFGIKGKGNNGYITLPTTEHVGDQNLRVNANFASYSDYKSSFEAHQNLMKKSRYANVWNAKDQYEAFQAVKDAGYATDRKYPELLRGVYDKYLSPYFQPQDTSNVQSE